MQGALHSPRSHTWALPFQEDQNVVTDNNDPSIRRELGPGAARRRLWEEGLAGLCWGGSLVGLPQGRGNLVVTFGLWWFCLISTPALVLKWGGKGVLTAGDILAPSTWQATMVMTVVYRTHVGDLMVSLELVPKVAQMVLSEKSN